MCRLVALVALALVAATLAATDPKVCEVDTDFKRDAITHYDCKVKGVDADTCTKAGGKMEGEETDEETCAISMGGLSPLDPSSGPALDETQRKAACAKIGGTPTPVTCGVLIGYGIIGVPTSTDQCNAPTSVALPHVTQAKGMEWLGPKCCSGEKHHELCKGVAGKPEAKVCKLDSDWTPDAYVNFDCENEGLDKTECVGNGGEYDEGDKNCKLDMASFTTDAERSKECKKIGGVPRGNTCAAMKMYGQSCFVGTECCGGKAFNDNCGGPRELCEGGDADFNPTKSSQWPTDPGESTPTCGAIMVHAASALPAMKEDCADPVPNFPNGIKGNVLDFLAYHCCTTRKPAKTCGGRQESMCPGDEGGWANFVDKSYHKECKFVDVTLSQSDCKVIGGRWKTDSRDRPECDTRDDMSEDECTKAGGTLQDVLCSQNGILYRSVLGKGAAVNCSAPPTPDADHPLSWYVEKMGASCCESKTSNFCTISVEVPTAAKAAADKAFTDAGCEIDVTKAGCASLKEKKDAAAADLKKAEDADSRAGATSVASAAAVLVTTAVVVAGF